MNLLLPTYDLRSGKRIFRAVQPNCLAKGRFKVAVIDARTKRVVHERPWQPNLILDQGLDKIASMTWAAAFAYCAAGTGNTPTSDSSGGTTASQSGTTVTASAGFFASGDAGKLIRWGDGHEAEIRSFTDSTHVTVDRSQTVTGATFTMYRVNQTGLTAEVAGGAGRSNNYLTGSPSCDSSRTGAVFTMTRTYDFSSPAGSTNYAEIGVSDSGTQSNNLFSRMLISGGSVTVLSTQQLRVTYQLQVTVNPTTPSSKTATITGWPVLPATATSGTEQMAAIGMSKVLTSGLSGAWDGFSLSNVCNEPSGSGQIWISPSSDAHLSFPGSPDRRANATAKDLSLGSYSNGNFYRDKTATFSAGEANRTDYRSMGVAGGSFSTSINDVGFCFLFDQAQTKDNTHTLALTFRFTWGRDLS